MIDTTPEIDAHYREMLLQKTPQHRLEITCSMFDFAKTLAASIILNDRPDISKGELRAEIFRRFYAKDFDPERLEKIAQHIQQACVDKPS
jgi:hypothetical protein